MIRGHVWSCLHQVEVCGALRLHDSNDSGTSQVPQVPISLLFQLPYITYYSSTNSYSNLSLCFTCGVSDSTGEYTNLKCVSHPSLSSDFSQVLPGLTVCTVNTPRRGHRRTKMHRAAVAGAGRGGLAALVQSLGFCDQAAGSLGVLRSFRRRHPTAVYAFVFMRRRRGGRRGGGDWCVCAERRRRRRRMRPRTRAQRAGWRALAMRRCGLTYFLREYV
jgi:hypothetical protein